MPVASLTYQFGVGEQIIAALIADKMIPEGQGDRVQSVVIDSNCDGFCSVTLKMVATKDFLLTPNLSVACEREPLS